jgi:hypothetical protein
MRLTSASLRPSRYIPVPAFVAYDKERDLYLVGQPGERKKYPSLGLKPKNFRSVGT